jgi:hypothetical protein
VAEKAMSPPAPSTATSSKAELFAEVLAIVSSRERDVLAAIADGDGTPAARLRGAVRLGNRALQGRRLAHAMIVEPCERVDQARLVSGQRWARSSCA